MTTPGFRWRSPGGYDPASAGPRTRHLARRRASGSIHQTVPRRLFRPTSNRQLHQELFHAV